MYRAYPPPSSALFASQGTSGEDKKDVTQGPPKVLAPSGLRPPTMVTHKHYSSSSMAPSNAPLPPPLKSENMEPARSPDVSYSSSWNDSISQRRNELHTLQERANGSNADNLLARARAATNTSSNPTAAPPPPMSSFSSNLKPQPPVFMSNIQSGVDVKEQSPSPPRRSSIPAPKVHVTTTGTNKAVESYESYTTNSNENDGAVFNKVDITKPTIEGPERAKISTTVHTRPPPPPPPKTESKPSSEQPKEVVQEEFPYAPSPTAPYTVLTPSPPPQGNKPVPPTTSDTTGSKREALASLWNVAQTPNSSVAEVDTDHPPSSTFIHTTKEVAPVPEKIETTQNVPKESGTLRLVKELRKTKESLEDALKRESKLEAQIMELKLNSLGSESRGRAPRSIVDDRSNTESRRKRMKSPEPSGRKKNVDPLSDIDIASRAVETVDHIFESTLATYVVRKPYGGNEQLECTFKDEKSFNDRGTTVNWNSPVLNYLQNASVKDERTLEVAAKLKADGSILMLYGSSCRHGTIAISSDGNKEFEFKTFDDAEYMDGSLGKIIYIDTEGNDGEYWLDPVYEEALSIRETYCSNVFSAALALEATSPKNGSSSLQGNQHSFHSFHVANQPQAVKPPMTDACIGTEDLPLPPATSTTIESETKPIKVQPDARNSSKAVNQTGWKEKKSDMESFEKQGTGSTDILASFIIFFFSSIFSLLWFLFTIPVRISKLSVTLMSVIALYQIVWTLLADYEGSAMIDMNYNTH
jgi:hypothetical protein